MGDKANCKTVCRKDGKKVDLCAEMKNGKAVQTEKVIGECK